MSSGFLIKGIGPRIIVESVSPWWKRGAEASYSTIADILGGLFTYIFHRQLELNSKTQISH